MTDPRPITIYDTRARAKRPLEPIEPGKVRMYVCGVTVYDLTHIGHARTFVVFDVVQRFLRHLGYDLTLVRNHTDVDDKILERAREHGVEPLALSAEFIEALEHDMAALGVAAADVEPLVSTHIPQIIEMVEALIERGHAYATDAGDVFYRVRSFENYGELSRRSLDDMEAGRSGRVDDDTLGKEHPFDFALWKSAKPDDGISWDSPWGEGRPGWHIECSAMAQTHLGAKIDIHGGGQDLTFPHHENEIAQSEAASGQTPFAGHWMHVAMLNIDGEKMSKSLGNFWTTRDVLEGAHPEAIRLMMFQTHYRNQLNYSAEALDEGTRRLVYFYDALSRAETALARAGHDLDADSPNAPWPDKAIGHAIESFIDRYEEAMCDDFNVPLAVSYIHEQAKIIHELARSPKKPKPGAIRALAEARFNLVQGSRLLGLLTRPAAEALTALRDQTARQLGIDQDEVEAKIEARAQARAEKEWARADAIRDELLAERVEIMDSPEGTSWRILYEKPS